jgi:hypothetical protein
VGSVPSHNKLIFFFLFKKLARINLLKMGKLLKQGMGWRLGWNPDAEIYQGLVGSDYWAIELTAAELTDFCRLLQQLTATMTQMAAELMEEEKIACEVESDLLWLEVEGFPKSYSLRMILYRDRGFEGNWRDGVAGELVKQLDTFKGF